MAEMKSDMAGAAAVVQATFAIADLGLPLEVTTYAADGREHGRPASMRPGDVITMYGGTTVEIMNTDAEGRLVLGRRPGDGRPSRSPTCCSTSPP